jgi:GcrA cell cycle regulator
MSYGNAFSEAEDERLRVLWDEGHSSNEIGRRMRRSKNSVIGRAHRLKLPLRQSPIQGYSDRKLPASKSVRATYRKRKAVAPPIKAHVNSALALQRAVERQPRIVVVAAQAVVARPAPIPRAALAGTGCRWPMWSNTERATHVYCDAVRATLTHPYCDAHRAVGCRKVEEAA